MKKVELRRHETGFTLVESLVAIIVLIFGLMAVTNLLLVAASSNTVANQGTAAAVSASQVLENMRNVPFSTLVPLAGGGTGGSLTASVGPTGPCTALPQPPAAPTTFNCTDDLPGVGLVVTRWTINVVPGTARALYIQVRSEGQGALAQARSRAEFTTLRTCTDSAATAFPCPVPP